MRLACLTAFLACFVFTAVTAAPPENVSSAPPRTPAEELKAFHLPEGFVAELVAAEPEIHKPLNIAFDDQGRLWVTDTLEYPFPVPVGKPGRDGVKILSDFGPDGKARKVEMFTTGLNIPIGLLPLPGGKEALVHSIPNVFKVSGADKKEPIYQTFGARDTHGMTNAFSWGFDGWIYACHGFSNESNVKGADHQPITMQSGNTYRMKPDGSHLEYFTHGQVNPFGLAFDPLGNLYSCDCHSRPVYQLLRGAYYPSFGKPDDGLGFGPEMATHDHGSTAIAGIVYYAADQFPKAYQDRVYIGNPVTNRINQDTIEWHGSSPKAIEQPDFMTSDDPWYRPVDLELGPDGALYIADFYNRIIGHYEVPLTHPGRDRERGRIWRIVYRGKDGQNKLGTIPSQVRNNRALLGQLSDPNIVNRINAANQLSLNMTGEIAKRVEGIVRGEEQLTSDLPAGRQEQRVHSLWVLQRSGFLNDETLAIGARDSDRTLRVHAMRVLSERAKLDETLIGLATKGLTDSDPFVRRAAAEALGRHRSTANIKPLIALRAATPADDTHLIHVARMALRDQLLADESWLKLEDLKLDDSERDAIADVAPGVHSLASARFLFAYLKMRKSDGAILARYVHHIGRYGNPELDRDLLAFVQSAGTKDAGLRVDLFKAYQQGLQERGVGLGEDARKLALTMTEGLLNSAKPSEIASGIALAGSFRLEAARKTLEAIVLNGKAPEPRRNDAMAALVAIDPHASIAIVGRVLTDASAPAGLRERGAALLGSAGRSEAVITLINALPTAPARIQAAIAAGLVQRKAGGEALLGAIGAGKASARLLQENRVAGPLGMAGIPNISERLEKLLHGLPAADARINALIATRRAGFGMTKGEPATGAKIFETNCALCHQIGGKGAKIGPQLDGVGLRGVDRLLEDILDPSRNVDQTFRLTTLALRDGRVVSGLLLREEGEVIVLADSLGKEVRVPKPTIEERTIAPLSPMPVNFAEQLPESDFYGLIAYLLTQRPAQK